MRPIPGFEAYCADEQGNIYSQYENGTGKLCGVWRKITPVPQRGGYQHVTLYKDRVDHQFGVHVLVLLTFIGPCPAGMEGCHNDGDPSNNALYNLRWDTRPNNHADKLLHGTHQRGQRNGNAKLSDELATAMLTEYLAGDETSEQVGRRYGVSGSLVRKMASGRVRACA